MIERALRPTKSEFRSVSGRIANLIAAGLLPLSEGRVEELKLEARTAVAEFEDLERFLLERQLGDSRAELAVDAWWLLRTHLDGKLREIRLQLAMDTLARRRRDRGRPRLPYPAAELAQLKADGLPFGEALDRLVDDGVLDPDSSPSDETLRRRWREIA